jgi:hypothetical protein
MHHGEHYHERPYFNVIFKSNTYVFLKTVYAYIVIYCLEWNGSWFVSYNHASVAVVSLQWYCSPINQENSVWLVIYCNSLLV